MKTDNEKVAIFHIGRGGRFNNAGHLEFLEIGTIADAERRLGDDVFYHDERAEDEELLEELRRNGADSEEIAEVEERLTAGDYRAPYYTDCAGNEVGEVGVGHYDFDGQYDTLYCARLDGLTDADETREDECELHRFAESLRK